MRGGRSAIRDEKYAQVYSLHMGSRASSKKVKYSRTSTWKLSRGLAPCMCYLIHRVVDFITKISVVNFLLEGIERGLAVFWRSRSVNAVVQDSIIQASVRNFPLCRATHGENYFDSPASLPPIVNKVDVICQAWDGEEAPKIETLQMHGAIE